MLEKSDPLPLGGQRRTPVPRAGVWTIFRNMSIILVMRKPVPLEAVNVGAALRKPAARRTERVNFLTTPAEKAEILKEAESRGLTITEYFLRLHRRVMEAGRTARPGKRRGPD